MIKNLKKIIEKSEKNSQIWLKILDIFKDFLEFLLKIFEN